MAATGEMVKDPICGTYVPADANIRARVGDKVYAFCSYECRDAFIKRLEATQTQAMLDVVTSLALADKVIQL